MNPGGHYNSTTGIYTAPYSGLYEFNINIRSQQDHDFGFYLVEDGTDIAHGRNGDASGPGYLATGFSIPVHAVVGQEYWVRPWNLNAMHGRTVNDGELASWFAAYLVHVD